MKRPSGTKPSPTPPEPTFFTDRDLGKTVPRILRENGLLVERYCDHFHEANVTDAEWLTFAAQQGWISLSHDRNIKRDPVAVRTIMERSGRLFIVRGALTAADLAAVVLGALKSIRNILARQKDEAFIAIVRRGALQGGALHPEAHVHLTFAQWSGGREQVSREDDEPAYRP